MKRITAEKLTEMGACQSEVDTFRKEWPKGCLPTLKNIRRARELDFDLGWYAEEALSPAALTVWDNERDAAHRAWNTAWDATHDQYCIGSPARKRANAKADDAFDLAVAKALYHALKTGAKK